MNKNMKKYTIVFILSFFVGNRIFSIFISSIKTKNIVDSTISILYDFLPSFSSNYLGYSINKTSSGLLFSIVMGLVVVCILFYMSLYKPKKYMEGEEHGTARYGEIEGEASQLKDEEECNNIPYSQHISVSMNTRKTWLNNNTITIGGSGSGKTYSHVKPSALQMNCNYIIADPKDTVIKEIGNAFYKNGYDIKYLNLVNMSKSMKYNPLKYIEKPSDVLKFVNNFINNTTKENANQGGDDFFVKSEIAWMTFAIFFILACGDENERNLNTLMDLLDLADASEEDENSKCELDIMVEQLEKSYQVMKAHGIEDKNSYQYLAIRQYHLYKKAAGKTAKSILISLGVRLAVFNIPELQELLSDDELDLETIGRPKKDENGNYIKTVLFIAISDYDSTFTFMASVIYQQLYEILYRIADDNPNGKLPIHTRFICDEFANTGKQQDFEIKIATMRSREISVDIILQNLAQLKNLYKESWETIVGNCDVTLFLGGKEYSTLEQLSKWIGNTTLYYLSITENKGANGSWSKNNQLLQRPLLAPDEIGRLKRDECLIHIRGEHIFRDTKYSLQSHPQYKLTADYDESLLFDPQIIVEKVRKKRIQEIDKEVVLEEVGDINFLDSNKKVHYTHE